MRIAHVMLAKKFGGAERSFVDLARALAARGHSVLAIGDPRGVALASLADESGIECVAVRCFGSWDRIAEHHMRHEFARFRPAVVHAHLARAAHLGGRAAQALGIPTLAKTHNLVNLKYYQHIDCLVPTTRLQETYLRDRGIAPDAMQRIPNFSLLEPVHAVPAPGRAPYRIVSLGRFVAKKGFDVLIAACAQLVDAGCEVTLDLAGEGPDRGSLEQAIQRHGLATRVRLQGWVDDVRAFLDGADLFVLPSHDEPFGIVLLEAMACGIPIVATRTAGPSEVLGDEAALLAPTGDAEALAAAMRASLGDPAAQARAAIALERYRTMFSAEQVVTQYLDLYARLAQ